MYEGSITDVIGITVGQVEVREARTGVTAVLCPPETVGGVDVRGAAPGTRETDLLRPGNLVKGPNAVLLCGGSAYGLAAADGAMRFFEELGEGMDVGVCRVPIVPAAVLFDLGVGRSDVRPGPDMGYAACRVAGNVVRQGAYGAGCGATVGKLVPGATPARGGTGTASITLADGVHVGAIVCVNACGDVYDPQSGAILACGHLGGRPSPAQAALTGARLEGHIGENTTLGVIATDAKLSKEEANRLALSAHDGYARAIRPVHTMMDGDTIFSMATGQQKGRLPFLMLCAAAAEVMARAIANAVTAAKEEA